MKIKSLFATALFSAGVLAGILGVESSLAVTAAYAHSASTSGPMMGTTSKSKGDMEMMAVMEHMQSGIGAIKMTGDQDRDFMLMMIPHHQSAIGMAKVELARGKHPALKALASDIVSSQGLEIGKMKSWLKMWYAGSM